jgi:coatomer subunit beta
MAPKINCPNCQENEWLENNEFSYLPTVMKLDDGTYAQETMTMGADQTATASDAARTNSNFSSSSIRQLIKNGEYYLACVLAQALLKLMLRLALLSDSSSSSSSNLLCNELKAKCLLIVTAILRYGSSEHKSKKMSPDCRERMRFVLNCLRSPVNEHSECQY